MPYCPKCETRLPEDEKARFCPNCGTPLPPRARYEAIKIIAALKERKIGTSLRRTIVFTVMVVLCFAATALGAVSKLEHSEAQELLREAGKLQDAFKYAGVQVLFGNNFMHCLLMFTPVLGPPYGFYVLYMTGRVLAATGPAVGLDAPLLLVTLFLFPFAWLEYISYGIAVSESLWLVYMAVRRKFKAELTNASKAVAVCAVLLLLAAFIEMLQISALPP